MISSVLVRPDSLENDVTKRLTYAWPNRVSMERAWIVCFPTNVFVIPDGRDAVVTRTLTIAQMIRAKMMEPVWI